MAGGGAHGLAPTVTASKTLRRLGTAASGAGQSGLPFDGALSSWNNGRATLKDGVIEFYWKNAYGFNQWFVYSRGR